MQKLLTSNAYVIEMLQLGAQSHWTEACTYTASLPKSRFDSKLGEDGKNYFTEVSTLWSSLHL